LLAGKAIISPKLTKKLNVRGSQRFSKRAANATSVNYGYVQTNSQKENLMNTHTNAIHPQKKAHRTIRKNLVHSTAIMTIMLALVTAAAIAVYTANRPVVAENSPAVLYSNALEMQYAQPWLEAQNKSVVAYSNALEMQYAQPWLEAQNKPVVAYGNALEMQYAQPWLDKAQLPIVVTGNAQEQIPLNCHSTMEMLYACKYGYRLP
jgi:cell division protein FtsL